MVVKLVQNLSEINSKMVLWCLTLFHCFSFFPFKAVMKRMSSKNHYFSFKIFFPVILGIQLISNHYLRFNTSWVTYGHLIFKFCYLFNQNVLISNNYDQYFTFHLISLFSFHFVTSIYYCISILLISFVLLFF